MLAPTGGPHYTKGAPVNMDGMALAPETSFCDPYYAFFPVLLQVG